MKRIKRKRNPVDDRYINLLEAAIIWGDPQTYVGAKIYLKQGEMCKDCGENFSFCDCDECNDCLFHQCLCDLGVISILKYGYEDNVVKNKEIIRKAAWTLAKETLNKQQLNKLKESIKIEQKIWRNR